MSNNKQHVGQLKPDDLYKAVKTALHYLCMNDVDRRDTDSWTPCFKEKYQIPNIEYRFGLAFKTDGHLSIWVMDAFFTPYRTGESMIYKAADVYKAQVMDSKVRIPQQKAYDLLQSGCGALPIM